MINQGKIWNYILYAIGEIILVVAGILIAVEIDSIYKMKEQRKIEISILEEMKTNLEQDLNQLEGNILRLNYGVDIRKQIISELENSEPDIDTLSTLLYYSVNFTYFVKNSSAYQNLLARGLDIISNDSLRRAITTLYEENYFILNLREKKLDRINDEVFDCLISKVDLDEDTRSASPIDLNALKNDNTAKNLIKAYYVRVPGMTYYYENAQNQVQYLIGLINKEK